jgi:hypothetical protein
MKLTTNESPGLRDPDTVVEQAIADRIQQQLDVQSGRRRR